jgi:hypothetical protein
VFCIGVFVMSHIAHKSTVLALAVYNLSDLSNTLYSLFQCSQRLNFVLNH